MTDRKKVNFFDINKNEKYKSLLISTLIDRVSPKYKMELLEIFDYVIDNNNVFRVKELEGSFYEGEDQTLDLILPAVVRVFNKVFIDPPHIFKDTTYDDGIRLEMFQLSFDIDDFNKYLVDMLLKTKNALIDFENIDRTAETISLIIDNYIAGLISNVLDSYDIKGEVTKLRRDRKLKELTK
jgi:hypothetical protein